MGYRELLQALEDEVERQIAELREGAAQQRRDLLATTRREIDRRRQQALAEARHRLAADAAEALSLARVEGQRAMLVEMRAAMADLRAAAEAGLALMDQPDLLKRLLDETAKELDNDDALVFRTSSRSAPLIAPYLAARHPALLARSTVESSASIVGGVEVSIAGRQRFDNTLSSRLRVAWERLEPELAARLFPPIDARSPATESKPGPVDQAPVPVGEGDGAL
ncbi:MAG: V-type ATP synthase subunit E [Vicinamibacterales bacterium]